MVLLGETERSEDDFPCSSTEETRGQNKELGQNEELTPRLRGSCSCCPVPWPGSAGQGHPWPCSWKLYYGEKNRQSLHGMTCPEWLSSKTKPHGDFRPQSHVAVTARVAEKTNRAEPAAPAQTRPLASYPDADFHSEAQLLLSLRWVSPVGRGSWVNPRTHLPSCGPRAAGSFCFG